MTVQDLKEILQRALNDLDYYDDDQVVKKHENTYFLGGARYFLGIAGYDGGYIDIANIDIEEEEDYE